MSNYIFTPTLKLYTPICLPFGKYENKHPIIITTSHWVNQNQIAEQIKLKINQSPLYLWQDMFGQRRSGYYQSYVRLAPIQPPFENTVKRLFGYPVYTICSWIERGRGLWVDKVANSSWFLSPTLIWVLYYRLL